MRNILGLLLLLSATLFSCSKATLNHEEIMKAAQQYYEHLLKGEYEQFVNGSVANRDIPEQYRRQLTANAKMFVEEQKNTHRGISKVQATGADVDEENGLANVFLVLCFGDSTNEEVVIPMVEDDGVWRMR